MSNNISKKTKRKERLLGPYYQFMTVLLKDLKQVNKYNKVYLLILTVVVQMTLVCVSSL